MTIDEAIAKIPKGYRLRLTNYEALDPDTGETLDTGWGAELFTRDATRRGIGDEKTAAEAILAAIKEVKP